MNNKVNLPVVFVRALVVFPRMSVTLTVGRPSSRMTVDTSQQQFEGEFVALTQLRAEDQEVRDLNDVYALGTRCKIKKVVTLTDGTMQVQIEGLQRFRAESLENQAEAVFVQGESLIDSDHAPEASSRQLLESISSYRPTSFEKVAWLERTDLNDLTRINADIGKRHKILEESSENERVKLLQLLDQEKS